MYCNCVLVSETALSKSWATDKYALHMYEHNQVKVKGCCTYYDYVSLLLIGTNRAIYN